jgi:hypothetical protein
LDAPTRAPEQMKRKDKIDVPRHLMASSHALCESINALERRRLRV